MSTADRPVCPLCNETADEPADSPLRATRRRRLLEAAQRTFVRDGYRHATMERVAEDAGVSKQTLYNYFADKDELFASLLEMRKSEQSIDAIEAAMALISQGDTGAALAAMASAFMQYGTDAEMVALHRIIIELNRDLPELMLGLRQRFFYQNVERVRAALDGAAAAGKLRQVDSEAVAFLLFGLAASFGMFRPAQPDPVLERLSPDRMARTLADLLCHGLLPPA